MKTIFTDLEIIVLVYFAFAVFYALVFALAGCLRNRKLHGNPHPINRIAVLIPAYKEDAVIVPVAQQALAQQYPTEQFDVVVIADQLQVATIAKLKALPIKLVEVQFNKSTKVKSLNAAMSTIGNNYDMAVILDADNIMEDQLLAKMNAVYNGGHKAIQGQRVAKNMNTSFAILDALSEIINNHIYRKGHFELGFSASLIGSGMAFDYALLKKTLADMHAVGGFDRELEVRLVGQQVKTVYVQDALVYDEKVEKPDVFENQRKRWIASQFVNLRLYFKPGLQALFKGDMVYVNSAILRNLQLPRLLTLGLLALFALIGTVAAPYLYFRPVVWWTLLGLNVLSFVLAVPLSFYSKDFFKALLQVPRAFFILFMLLFRIKGANRQFIHTPHGNTSEGKLPAQ